MRRLPDAAKTRLDQMVNQLKADPKGIFIEIEGHTDKVGAAAYNEHLGLERAILFILMLSGRP